MIDTALLTGQRSPTPREMWKALWSVYRACRHAGGDVPAANCIAELWVVIENLTPRWGDRIIAAATAVDDRAMTFPASNPAFREIRRRYFERLRKTRGGRVSKIRPSGSDDA